MTPDSQIVDVQIDLLAEASTELAAALSALRQVESELAVRSRARRHSVYGRAAVYCG